MITEKIQNKNSIECQVNNFKEDSFLQIDNDTAQSCLLWAVQNNDTDLTRLLAEYCEKHNLTINFRNDQDRTPLMIAVEQGNTKLAKLLLEHGANPELRIKKDWRSPTCLLIAVRNSDLPMIECLVEFGADLEAADPLRTALDIATRRQDIEIVEYLLAKKVSISPAALLETIKKQDTGMLERFFKSGNPINQDLLNKSLDRAPNIEIFTYLIEHGAQITDLQQSLAYSIRLKNLEIVKYLVDRGAQIDLLFSQEPGIINTAVPGTVELLTYLFEHGAKARSVQNSNTSLEELKYLVEQQGLLFNPLFLPIAVLRKDKKMVKYILEHEFLVYPPVSNGIVHCYLNVGEDTSRTPLMIAVEGGDIELVQMVGARGALDVAVDGETAMDLAIKNRRPDLVRCLMELGASVKGDSGTH